MFFQVLHLGQIYDTIDLVKKAVKNPSDFSFITGIVFGSYWEEAVGEKKSAGIAQW